jgi:integrase
MSVAKRGKVWVVRWRDHTGRPQKTFKHKRDALLFDAEITRRKRLGTLAQLDAGSETLDEYVADVWIPIHVATLADKTASLYAGLYDRHVSPHLGGYPLRELTSEVVGRWQADRLAQAGAPVESIRKSLTLLGGILQRAVEAGRIPANPQRLVRKAAPKSTQEVRPLAPASVEAIRAGLRQRDAVIVSLLAYAGLRPQEARGLRWAHVGERTLTVHAPKTRRHATQPRSVRLLAPLAQDLRELRMASGRPIDAQSVIPGHDGCEWSEVGYEQWITRVWAPALDAAGIAYQRPYDLRHSFASLLLHEGRSVIYVARQIGHSAQLTMRTFGHVIEELDEAPRITAEDAIHAVRANSGGRIMDASNE